MNRWMRRGGTLFVVMVAASSLACDRPAAEEGEKGNLEFYYHPADGSTDFDRPVAMGSSMYMYVDPLEGDLNAVVDAYAEPESVLQASVAQDEDYAIALRGLTPGDATLYAEVDSGGSSLSDHIEMSVDLVDEVAMGHECTSYADAAYVVDRPIHIPMERRNSSGEQLVGAAHAADGETDDPDDYDTACQVWMDPQDTLDYTDCDEAGLHISPIQELGDVIIEPIDGVAAAGGHSSLGVHVVDEDVIELVSVEGSLSEGSTSTVEIEAITAPPGNWDVCGGLELHVEILTPHTCEGTGLGGSTSFSLDADDENSFRLRGENAGWCEFAVSFENRPGLGEWIFDLYVEPDDD